jgi:hypothetical protein
LCICGSFCFEYFFKLHILKCKVHQKMETTRISEKKVKSLLLYCICGSFCFEYFFKLHILKCKVHQKMDTTRISEKKVKSLLLPKDATNFSYIFPNILDSILTDSTLWVVKTNSRKVKKKFLIKNTSLWMKLYKKSTNVYNLNQFYCVCKFKILHHWGDFQEVLKGTIFEVI